MRCKLVFSKIMRDKRGNKMTNEKFLNRLVFLAMMVAVGVVISPLLRVEGFAPMQHLVNVTCAVFLGPWYSLACAVAIGVIRMSLMGIPPLALTGAVFGAFLSGIFYAKTGKIWAAVLGEIIGTGLIGSIVSYPIMTLLYGKSDLTWLFYVPSFCIASTMGGTLAGVMLYAMQKNGVLAKLKKVWDEKMIKKPLIHYITHPIVMTDCANAILAIGGSPIMAEHHAEVQDITAKSSALVVNLGNITDYRMQAMRLSGQVALEKRLPIVLDLTGIAVSSLRRTFAHDFITMFSPQLVKGNVSEILALLAFATQANGVDTGDNRLTTEQLMKMRSFCQAHSCILLVTGEIDVIVDLGRFICLKNGSDKLTQVTGTGCLLSGMLGYFLSQVSDLETVDAVVKAVGLLTIASESADKNIAGLGSFKASLFDYLGNLKPNQIKGKILYFERQMPQDIVRYRKDNRHE